MSKKHKRKNKTSKKSTNITLSYTPHNFTKEELYQTFAYIAEEFKRVADEIKKLKIQ